MIFRKKNQKISILQVVHDSREVIAIRGTVTIRTLLEADLI